VTKQKPRSPQAVRRSPSPEAGRWQRFEADELFRFADAADEFDADKEDEGEEAVKSNDEQDEDEDEDEDADEDEDEDEDEGKPRKKSNRKPKLKLSHFTTQEAHVLRKSFPAFRVQVACEDGFPSLLEQSRMANRALAVAMKTTGVQITATFETQTLASQRFMSAPRSLTLVRQILQRTAQLRGELARAARKLVPAAYKLKNRRKHITANRKRVKLCLDRLRFLYKVTPATLLASRPIDEHAQDVDKQTGFLRHPVLQEIIRTVWFNGPKAEGVVYSAYFDPLPVPLFALTLTAVSTLLRDLLAAILTIE
jgi:hypothetical protein